MLLPLAHSAYLRVPLFGTCMSTSSFTGNVDTSVRTGMEKMKNAVLPYIRNYLMHNVKEDK